MKAMKPIKMAWSIDWNEEPTSKQENAPLVILTNDHIARRAYTYFSVTRRITDSGGDPDSSEQTKDRIEAFLVPSTDREQALHQAKRYVAAQKGWTEQLVPWNSGLGAVCACCGLYAQHRGMYQSNARRLLARGEYLTCT